MAEKYYSGRATGLIIMKRVIVICEGQTELEFCKNVLYNHFWSKGIILQGVLIKKSGGGIVPWDSLKKQIDMLLHDKEVIVTTLLDYYGIMEKHNFPAWKEAHEVVDRNERIKTLEQAMQNDLPEAIRHRFIPYIQLHEFEGLLFNDIAVFDELFSPAEITNRNRRELETIINQHPNPELINNTLDNAPSKRLKRLVKGYEKLVYGTVLAISIGLSNIRNKCVHFNEWISHLETV